VSAVTREDYAVGVTQLVAAHPADADPQARYAFVVAALEGCGFTPDELRGMLAVALDQIAKAGAASRTEHLR
jgi:hypothetical protein